MKNATSLDDLQTIFDVIPSPVFLKDRNHQLVLVNSAACTLFGHPREVLLTVPDSALFPPDQVKVFHEADNRVFDGGAEDESEEEVTGASGSVRSVITRKRSIRLGGQDFLIGVVTDVTARREAEAHNRYLAFHDHLTGLPNRALLNECIEQALPLMNREPQGLALMYIDLDRFKEVNDQHGHQSGDKLIRAFAVRLTGIVRACATVARLGGDEFAILLPTMNDGLDPADVCQRVTKAASEAFLVDGKQLFVGASIGIAFAPNSRIGQIELQRRADVALYQAKREGRGCWRTFTEDLDEETKERRRLEVDMHQALESGRGFEVFYQPMVAASDESVVSVEALLRWRHPQLGMLLPDVFIPIAEETGLIVPLGDWVLTHACTMVARWPHLTVAVNISPTQLRRAGVAERILAIVARSGLHPGRLELEVTETTMLATDSASSEALKALRATGIRIVLDDFGTGYSSLAHLQKLKVDKVKIDRSFVQQLGGRDGSEAIVLALAALCKKLGISVTAEGVETDAQRQFLRSSACTEFQGFLFSRPLSQSAAIAFLDAALGSPSLAA
jgi:diguanylate cyclase (GGDEF)-like protein/PAS domain S-box-containing protein